MDHIRRMWCCLCISLLTGCGGGGGSSGPTVATVTVTPVGAIVGIGQQVQFAATVKDAMGNMLSTPVTWTSSNPALASINATGLAMGVAIGPQVTITASSEGQSGTAVVDSEPTPQFAAVTLGNNHTCGLTNSGIAFCWGDNLSGQLGDGTGISNPAPVTVITPPSLLLPFFSSISAGGDHTCAIGVLGAAYCWGNNSSGELGNGTTTTSVVPMPVSGGLSFVAVSAGAHHTCGLTADGTAYCWGDNTFGQLGNGTTTSTTTPVAIINSPPWTRISAGATHTCSIYAVGGTPPTGIASCWGDNSAGQFGNGTTMSSLSPVAVQLPQGSGGASFAQQDISAGSKHACGVANAGGAAVVLELPGYCWGDNSSGQLGNGTNTNSDTPIVVAGGLNWAMVVAGGGHTCDVDMVAPVS